MSLPERFTSKFRIDESGCWVWTASLVINGYGQFNAGRGRSKLAHRFAYEHLVGPIPVGLDLDHLCRVRACVNPAHLEPVTRSENLRRSPLSPYCSAGHEFTPENTYMNGRRRYCRACQKIKTRLWYSIPENREKALAKAKRQKQAAKERAA